MYKLGSFSRDSHVSSGMAVTALSPGISTHYTLLKFQVTRWHFKEGFIQNIIFLTFVQTRETGHHESSFSTAVLKMNICIAVQ
jgi:hypothetical protein